MILVDEFFSIAMTVVVVVVVVVKVACALQKWYFGRPKCLGDPPIVFLQFQRSSS